MRFRLVLDVKVIREAFIISMLELHNFLFRVWDFPENCTDILCTGNAYKYTASRLTNSGWKRLAISFPYTKATNYSSIPFLSSPAFVEIKYFEMSLVGWHVYANY